MTTTNTSADLIERIALRYGALPEEIEEAKKYKPSFVELATLPALGKRSYYRPSSLRAHRLQAVLVEEYLLMRYSQKENSAFFINIATLSSLEQAVIRKVMIEQDEIPLAYILAACEHANIDVKPNETLWADLIACSKSPRTMPVLLATMLSDLATIPSEIQELRGVLSDLVEICRNSFTPALTSGLPTTNQPREDMLYERGDKLTSTTEFSRKTTGAHPASEY